MELLYSPLPSRSEGKREGGGINAQYSESKGAGAGLEQGLASRRRITISDFLLKWYFETGRRMVDATPENFVRGGDGLSGQPVPAKPIAFIL
jgi:hypothetical protein